MMSKVSEKLLEQHRAINAHDEWWDSTHEAFTERMQEVGIEVGDIEFSGFWSQGDGASFTGKISNLTLYLSKFHKDDEFPELRKLEERGGVVDIYWVRTDNRYVHECTLYFDSDVTLAPAWRWWADPDMHPLRAAVIEVLEGAVYKQTDELREAVKENIQAICRKLYRQLEEEYEYLTSDEAVTEAIIANDLHKE